MKKKLIFLTLLLFTAYILFFPKDAVTAAAEGLVLWYDRVLPTLLPFAILSNILISSGYVRYLNRLAAPLIRCFLPVSDNGAFVVLTGFLFGFPMGSKNCAELLRQRRISIREAEILFAVTNNISPVFISSYILRQQLALEQVTLISYAVLYLPPLLCGWLLLHRAGCIRAEEPHRPGMSGTVRHLALAQSGASDSRNPEPSGTVRHLAQSGAKSPKTPASESKMNFKIIDAGIMNGFETLTRLGGYIMLFSMAASALKRLPFPEMLRTVLTGFTEITNGISLLPQSGMPQNIQYLLAMTFTAFGGLSGLAQTSSMTKGCGLSLKRYCAVKMLCTGTSALLAWGVTVFFL